MEKLDQAEVEDKTEDTSENKEDDYQNEMILQRNHYQ